MHTDVNTRMIIRSLWIWLTIIPLAIINGGIREYILIPFFGATAFPLSGIMLSAMIFLLTYLFLAKLGKGTQRTYVFMGIVWIVFTIAFEFLLGFAGGESFSEMLSAYDLFTGNLWLLVVLFTGIAPWLAAKKKKII